MPAGGSRIPLEQRHQVVGALLLVLREQVEDEPGEAALIAARLDDHREVGRHRVVAGARLVVVLERRREAVGQPARRSLTSP